MSQHSIPEDFTVGVEEEYQVVDPGSGELRSRARTVLSQDWTGEIKPEMLANSVEVGTRVCCSADELAEELGRLRLQAGVAAEAGGLRVVAAGVHPFDLGVGHEFSAGEVYQQLRAEYRSLAIQQSIFGLHVHVGVPDGVDRVRVMNVVRQYLPHLLALSASSPLFMGEDTGYSSYRSLLWRRWPRTGAPPRLQDEDDFRRMVGVLMETGCIDAPGRIYWSIRPHHQYPTLEFRVADVTPRLEDAILIAVLARALVAGAVEGVIREPRLPEDTLGTLLVENSWRAARDGLGAELIEMEGDRPEPRPVERTVQGLAERLSPLIAHLGDAQWLNHLPLLLERRDAAWRIRAQAREMEGDPAALVRWLADETLLGTGMDRRREQRVGEL